MWQINCLRVLCFRELFILDLLLHRLLFNSPFYFLAKTSINLLNRKKKSVLRNKISTGQDSISNSLNQFFLSNFLSMVKSLILLLMKPTLNCSLKSSTKSTLDHLNLSRVSWLNPLQTYSWNLWANQSWHLTPRRLSTSATKMKWLNSRTKRLTNGFSMFD